MRNLSIHRVSIAGCDERGFIIQRPTLLPHIKSCDHYNPSAPLLEKGEIILKCSNKWWEVQKNSTL